MTKRYREVKRELEETRLELAKTKSELEIVTRDAKWMAQIIKEQLD
jgi:hypothetical protein